MTRTDKNFDALAERFSKRVYGGLKGEIRLQVIWRDILEAMPSINESPLKKPLRILDIGGGLGQISIRLAELGHELVFNDLSEQMCNRAKLAATTANVEHRIKWHVGPYQSLLQHFMRESHTGFDLILCHALLEWLAEPEKLIPSLKPLLTENGTLSLCYYNPAAKIYRNLIRGNFDWLNNQSAYRSDAGSLTPNHPCTMEQVNHWLTGNGLASISESGIRVFSDYVVEKRGGHQSPEDVLRMELKYSQLNPYKNLGRYQHLMARPMNAK